MNLKVAIKFCLLFLIVIFIISLFYAIAIYAAVNWGYAKFPVPSKVSLGNSNMPLESPWGENTNLSVFANLENVSIKDREYYVYHVLLAMKWWENDRSHNLSYSVNFTMTNKPDNSNIIVKWSEIIYDDKDVGGTTHINSSGLPHPDPLGVNICDTYNPPFKKCIIEIRKNLTYDENFYVIKHEMGHALGLKHSFNESDFFILFLGFNSNYLLSRSEIMFDIKDVYLRVMGYMYGIIWKESNVLIILAFLIVLIFLLKYKYRWK